MESVLDKFLRYIAIDTASDPDSESQPSTQKQLDLSRMLVKELQAMGIQDVVLDEFGYVMASLPSNLPPEVKVSKVGFISHVDSAPDASGANIKPQIIKNYDGGDITINTEKNLVLKVSDFPELPQYKGQTIITTLSLIHI